MPLNYTVHWRDPNPPDIVETEVLVGFLGRERYPGTGPGGGGGRLVADVALTQERGTRRIPARRFISGAANLYGQGQVSGSPDEVGEEAVRIMQDLIEVWTTPPNAPITIEKKGFDNPLIHTRRMKNSVSYIVVNPPGPTPSGRPRSAQERPLSIHSRY